MNNSSEYIIYNIIVFIYIYVIIEYQKKMKYKIKYFICYQKHTVPIFLIASNCLFENKIKEDLKIIKYTCNKYISNFYYR